MARKRGRSIEDRVRDQVKRRDEKESNFRPILDFSGLDKTPPSWRIEKAGKQRISILPYVVSSENHPDLEPGDLDYKLEIYVHQGVGVNNDSVICMNRTYGKPCYICEERKRLMDSGLEWDDPEVMNLGSSRRVWYNIEVPDQKEKGVQIWHKVSWKNFEKALCATADEDYEEVIIFASLKNGAYVDFKAVEESFGKIKYFNFANFSLTSRPAIGEDKLDETYPLDSLLIIPTYDEVKTLFLGGDMDEYDKKDDPGEDDEPAREERPGRSSGQVRRKKNVEPDPEEDFDPEEDVEVSKCPYGHIFGLDCNKHDSCNDCDEDVFEECIDLQEEMKKEEPTPKRKLKRK